MNSLVEQTADFISQSTSPNIQEKSLSDSDIDSLLDKGGEVADAILKDKKRDAEERETAQDVLDWIKDVRPLGRKRNHFIQMLSRNS